ncbi:MAG: NHLP bacteriocin system secretion protein [Nostoc sp.]|uniref:NHLP bacteriocin system secretion protein n=1 Tax=Nostoc sp. TaxID=1180 RepID=UPI002FF603E5
MVEQKQSLFRKESLERLSSPERLDQLMQVVNLKSWLPLTTLGSLVVAAVIWSIFGRIPITVAGQGVVIYPYQVVPLQSTGSGQLLSLNVKVGDVVTQGQVLGTINQAQLNKELQQQRDKLIQLQVQDRSISLLQSQSSEQEKNAIEKQHLTLEQSLKITQSLTPVIKEKALVALQVSRQNLQQRLQTLEVLLPTYKQRWDNRQSLFKVGAVSDDTVLQARQDYLNNIANLDDAKSQLRQADIKEADAQRQYLEELNSMKDLQAQLQQLNSKKATQAQQDEESSTNRKNQIQEVTRTIAKLEFELKDNSQIISKHNGRILEITLTPGQVVNSGTRIASIAAEDSSSRLTSVTFFSVGDGKKIKPGMELQITPQTAKRERFGGIVGTVTTISAFPISKEAVANVIGNPEIVQGLVSANQAGLLQVFADMQLDPKTFSGYKWSSSTGPRLKISSGTTTDVRVKIEERAPITYIFPILRSVSGIY